MKKLLLLVLASALLLGACANASAAGYDGKLVKQSIEPLDDVFVQGIGDLGFSAASALYTPDQNLAVSPVSIELALCMARAGANGATKDEMTAALRLPGLSDDEITAACKALMWRANTGGMEAANALWLLDDYKYNDDYIKTSTEDYMADLKPLAIPGAMDDINAWAEEKTHGRIQNIMPDEPHPATMLMLTSALYYLGDWAYPFQAGLTQDDEFSTPVGPVTVPFMHSKWRPIPYYANDEFSMISLNFKPIKDEGTYAMAFLLPAQGMSIADLLASMDGNKFKTAVRGLSDVPDMPVWLPKFDFSFSAPLNGALESLGMQKAFEMSEADFSGVGKAGLFISRVLHKCYVRIDELGAEAAAATVVEAPAAEPPSEPPPEFRADRPFVFAIYSLEDGVIAFLGTVNDPSQK